jgi:hypothetical protein
LPSRRRIVPPRVLEEFRRSSSFQRGRNAGLRRWAQGQFGTRLSRRSEAADSWIAVGADGIVAVLLGSVSARDVHGTDPARRRRAVGPGRSRS